MVLWHILILESVRLDKKLSMSVINIFNQFLLMIKTINVSICVTFISMLEYWWFHLILNLKKSLILNSWGLWRMFYVCKLDWWSHKGKEHKPVLCCLSDLTRHLIKMVVVFLTASPSFRKVGHIVSINPASCHPSTAKLNQCLKPETRLQLQQQK